jgi:hypothetical protein
MHLQGQQSRERSRNPEESVDVCNAMALDRARMLVDWEATLPVVKNGYDKVVLLDRMGLVYGSSY